MNWRLSFVPCFVLGASLVLSTLGCAGDDGDSADTSNAAVVADEYADVVSRGTIVESDPTTNATYSAKVTLKGFIPNRSVNQIVDLMSDVKRWPEIKNVKKRPMFTSTKLLSDDHGELAAGRTLTV